MSRTGRLFDLLFSRGKDEHSPFYLSVNYPSLRIIILELAGAYSSYLRALKQLGHAHPPPATLKRVIGREWMDELIIN